MNSKNRITEQNTESLQPTRRARGGGSGSFAVGGGDVSPGNGKMEYRVTFNSMFGLALVLSIFAFSFIGYAIFYKKPLLVVPGVLLFALLVVIRFRFKVVVDEKQIEYTGLFTKKAIPFLDIVHSGWMFEHGYSKDRFYGSFVYEILSKSTSIRINFRLFPLDLMTTLIKELENLPASRQQRRNQDVHV